MTLIYRRIIYVTFFLIFFIVTPLIILYTEGYRYNFEKGRIQKTGVLIISSIPQRANIYLNESLVKNKVTPAKIERVLPGDYEIRLEKEGYHPWRKRLPVYANITTFAEKIMLWKKNWPEMIYQAGIDQWWPAGDQQKIAYATKENKIFFLNLNNQKQTSHQLPAESEIEIIGWSNTDKKLAVTITASREKYYLIFNWERPNLEPIKFPDHKYKSVKWDLKNDYLIYGLNEQGIWQLDLFTEKRTKIAAVTDTDDFIIIDGQIYLYQNQKIIKLPSDPQITGQEIGRIRCENCHFINQWSEKLLLFDQKNQNLFFIDSQGRIPVSQVKAKKINWLNQRTLIFYNDWEIWIYHLDRREPELITRLGQEITQAIWHPEGKHIIFSFADKIKIIELDNREMRNIIDLAETKNSDQLALDRRGYNLYFTDEINDATWILKLPLQ